MFPNDVRLLGWSRSQTISKILPVEMAEALVQNGDVAPLTSDEIDWIETYANPTNSDMNAEMVRAAALLVAVNAAAAIVMVPLSIIVSVFALEGLEKFDLWLRRKRE